MQRLTAIVFARNLVVHNSGIIKAVTGPAPNANVNTYLQVHITKGLALLLVENIKNSQVPLEFYVIIQERPYCL
jgi:hypothetical protein